jgi:predicted alpha/beta-hydrolase family hydrolase
VTAVAIDTPHGPARAHLRPAAEPWAALALGHGAGGGVAARDIGAAADAARAARTNAVAVLCLAFPLRPPRRPPRPLAPSRLPELDAVEVPTLVVQGDRDPFGIPPASRLRTVVAVPGTHSLSTDLEAIARAVRDWIRAAIPSAPPARG